MRNTRIRKALCSRRSRGYTLVGMMVAVTIIAASLAFVLPAFQNWIQRARVEGFGRELSVLLRQARSVAVRDGVPVVVALDEDSGAVFAFLDRSEARPVGPDDGVFNPDDGLPSDLTDLQIGRRFLPGGVGFLTPGGDDLIDGFTRVGAERVAVFEPDGCVRNSGAFRFGDQWGNYLEARVGPAASARVQLRKHTSAGGGANWQTREEAPWEWYWGKGRQATES